MFRFYCMRGILFFVLVTAAGCSQQHQDQSPNAADWQGEKAVDSSVFIKQSLEGLRTQTSAHAATWHLGKEADWAADQDTGRIRFTFKDGTIAEAELQIVGTYNTLDETFLRGWDHPSVAEPLRKHARLAKDFGEEHGLSEFTERMVKCSEDEAWEFTAVAARLGKANGAYRGPSGTALVYMTFGEVKLSKP